MSSWRPLPGLLSWCFIFRSSHCKSFEDQASEDFIYECLIRKLQWLDCIKMYENGSSSNGGMLHHWWSHPVDALLDHRQPRWGPNCRFLFVEVPVGISVISHSIHLTKWRHLKKKTVEISRNLATLWAPKCWYNRSCNILDIVQSIVLIFRPLGKNSVKY